MSSDSTDHQHHHTDQSLRDRRLGDAHVDDGAGGVDGRVDVDGWSVVGESGRGGVEVSGSGECLGRIAWLLDRAAELVWARVEKSEVGLFDLQSLGLGITLAQLQVAQQRGTHSLEGVAGLVGRPGESGLAGVSAADHRYLVLLEQAELSSRGLDPRSSGAAELAIALCDLVREARAYGH